MEETKYYDIVTKQEISKQEIKINTPYIALIGKWKIRILIHREDGKIDERFLTLQEEREAKKEILRQRLLQRGYKVEKITNGEYLIVDDIKINVPNYSVEMENETGQSVEDFFDFRSLESIVETTKRGRTISIDNTSISKNQSLIEIPRDLFDIESINREDDKKVSNKIGGRKHGTIINIDQWGYKKSYDLSKPGEIQRLMEDQKTMPRSREEAINYGENDDRSSK